jgi:Family of unknown function (DUF5856)
MELNATVQFLLETQLQFKICHWQTKEYARHMAFGSIYDSLDGLIDKFVESFMGKYGRFELSEEQKAIEVENLNELDLTSFIKIVKDTLLQFDSALDEKDSDLINIRDEMLFEVNKLMYLLTLE